MIHTKSLIRRLTHVPWLLAVGLVLGLAGESMAQYTVTLKFDETEVRIREEADATDVNVTATITSTGENAKAPEGGLDLEVVFTYVFADDAGGFVAVSGRR